MKKAKKKIKNLKVSWKRFTADGFAVEKNVLDLTRLWLKEKKVTVENVFFVILMFFSITFLGLVWAIGQDLNQNEPVKISQEGVNPMEKNVKKLVGGHPMENMTPFIAKQNNEVAKYLVAIAKKESNWGKFSPKKDGRDCYNYWGYRGTYNQTASGYSCFDSPKQAVRVVGERIGELLKQDIQTPEDMIVWKCGSSCAGHGEANVQKWIDDVEMYYEKL